MDNEEMIRRLFLGIVAGDGDALGRMASSHEGASPAYDEPLASLVAEVRERFDSGEFEDTPEEEWGTIAQEYLDRFLAAGGAEGEEE